jgi:hypothetical protein
VQITKNEDLRSYKRRGLSCHQNYILIYGGFNMQSSLIGKIEKAKRYAEEPERVTFLDFTTDFRGENNTYKVNYKAGKWHCTCSFFSQRAICSHTMALQRLLGSMLPKEALTPPVTD